MNKYLRSVFTLDVRALSLMRIAVALIILMDLYIRFNDLKAHYTDEGAFPIECLQQYDGNPLHWSLHTLYVSESWQIFLFIIAVVCAVFLLAGLGTRIFSVLSWVLMVSIHNRNPMIMQSGDDFLRLLLFFGMFMPWQKRYSLDALIHKNYKEENNGYLSFAGVGYVMLIFSLYFFSGAAKTSAEWITQGTAIYYALSLDQMVLPLGKILYHYPMLMKILTHFVWLTEIIVPFLLLSPYKNKQLRVLAIIFFACLQIGFGLTLYVGLFYLISLTGLIGILPFEYFKKKNETQPIVEVETSNFNRYKEYFLAFITAYCLIWNIANIPFVPVTLEAYIKYVASSIRIEQNWNMFSPEVFKNDGWFIAEAETESGKKIDLNRQNHPVGYTKPASILALHSNDRWRKFSENMQNENYAFTRKYYCKWMLRRFYEQTRGKEKLKQLRLIFMEEYTQPNYKKAIPQKKVLHTMKVQQRDN